MKRLRTACAVLLAAGAMSIPLAALAAGNAAPAAPGGAAAKAVKPYPLKTCVVSGSKLDAMGKPYVFTYQGREIKLCCSGCLPAFKKEPAKYLKILEAAEKAANKPGTSPKPN